MKRFLQKAMEARIQVLINSADRERKREEETNTNEKAKSMNVSKTFLTILKLSYNIKSKHEESAVSNKTKKTIKSLRIRMNNLFQSVTTLRKTGFDDVIVLAIAYFNLGYMYYFEELLPDAKDHFLKCIELLKKKELERTAILTAVRVHIFLSILWTKLEQPDNSYSLLEKAMELYVNYTKEEGEYPYPINVASVFDIEDESSMSDVNTKVELAELHQETLAYIAELYQCNPADKHKFAIHVHNLLNEDLGRLANQEAMNTYWANASIYLCYYFLSHDCFAEIESYLVTAKSIIEAQFVHILTERAESECTVVHNNYYFVCSHMAKVWGAYGVAFLRWKERLQCESDKSCKTNNVKSECVAKSEEGLSKPLIFPDISDILGVFVEKTFVFKDTDVLSLEQITVIFKDILKNLNLAKTYFTIEEHYVSHVDILILISKAYKYYLYFVQRKCVRIKLIEKRIKCLENVISAVALRYCNARMSVQVHKRFCIESAVAYSMLLESKSEEVDNIEEITDEMTEETDQLVKKTLKMFELALFSIEKITE